MHAHRQAFSLAARRVAADDGVSMREGGCRKVAVFGNSV